jgi:hypothetical protein
LPLFEKPTDYEAFERVLRLALDKHPTRLLGYWLADAYAQHALAHPLPDDRQWPPLPGAFQVLATKREA